MIAAWYQNHTDEVEAWVECFDEVDQSLARFLLADMVSDRAHDAAQRAILELPEATISMIEQDYRNIAGCIFHRCERIKAPAQAAQETARAYAMAEPAREIPPDEDALVEASQDDLEAIPDDMEMPL